MTLLEIAQTLYNEAASSGQVTINDALLGTGNAFAQLVESSLLRSAGDIILTASASNIPLDPPGTSFSFPAGIPTVASESFLNLLGNAATATIWQSGSGFQFELTIELTQAYSTGAALPWVFSTSFPSLFGWPFDAIPFSGPQFIFVFAPIEMPQGLTEGLNFQSPYVLTGSLAIVEALLTAVGLAPQLQPVAGAIQQTSYGPAFTLTGALGTGSINLIALVMRAPSLTLTMDYVGASPTSGPYEPHGMLTISGETDLVNNSSVTVPLLCRMEIPYGQEQRSIQLVIEPLDGVSTSIENLGSWMAGKSFDAFFTLPPANLLAPYLEVFGIQSYSLDLTLDSFGVNSSTLCVGTLQPWQVIPNNPNIIVENFSVAWSLIDPFGTPQNSVGLSAIVDLLGDGEVKFTGEIVLPDLELTLGLAAAPDMTAAQWLQTILTAFGGSSVTLPSYIANALSGFTMSQMMLSVNVTAEDMVYTLSGGFTVGGVPVDFNLFLTVALQPSFTYDIAVSFVFCNVSVAGEITNADGSTQISTAWQNDTNPLDINDIAISLGYPTLGIPSTMDLGLRRLAAVYDITDTIFAIGADSTNYGKADLVVFPPEGTQSFAFFGGLDVGHSIDLTNLPLVGQALSLLETVAIENLKVLVTSTVLSASQTSQLNAIITRLGGGFPEIPAQGMASTVNISMDLNLASYVIPFGSGVGGQTTTGLPATQSSVQGTPAGNTAAPVTTTPGAQSDGTSWFNVQKAVGPVMFRRIGVRYADQVLWFVLDCTFSAGGLTIDLIGASVGSPLSSFEPQFTLAGLGVTFREPGFELAGAFLNVPPGEGVDWEYAGGVTLRVANFSLSALGSYASMSGTPSMFLFGQVTGAFGGPPAFFITGFAAGFGYNTSLRLPAITEVYQFPFVAGSRDPSVLGGSDATPAQVLSILLGLNGGPAWITHEIGQYWFAAGISFTSYELVTSSVLAVVEFGKRLQFALLGLAYTRFPMAGPVTYAALELQIETVVDPSEGSFTLAAVLSPNCYLLDPACKLTGGFAFFAWFPPSDHAGDFVITAGGYHPSFEPPAWYPQVPPVGFSWSLDSTVSITGQAYLAMTPSTMMAGGQLNVTYQSGDLRAWFRAAANMLIYWNPFHFDADIGITVGASYRQNLSLTTATIEAEIGANLLLWGPATGGNVTVHWWVISFTIDFGAAPTPDSGPLTWSEFQEQLPPPTDTVKIVPGDGLVPNGSSDLSAEPWVVRPSGFSFTTMSAIPCSSLLYNYGSSSPLTLQTGDLINIRPMQVTGLTSTQTLTVSKDGAVVDFTFYSWKLTPRTQNVPKAMWGTGEQNQLDQGGDQLVQDQLVGFTVEAPAPVPGYTPGVINQQYLSLVVLTPEGILPITPNEMPQGPFAMTSNSAIATIESEIASPSYVSARQSLFESLQSLGVNPLTNGDMTAFADVANALFATEPMITTED